MSQFNRSTTPRTFSSQMGAPASVADSPTKQYGGIDFIFTEGHFLCDGTLTTHNATGFQPEAGPSTVTTRNMSANSVYLEDLITADATPLASTSTLAPALLSTDHGTYTHGSEFPAEIFDFDFSNLVTPSLTTGSSNLVSPSGVLSLPDVFQAEQASWVPPCWDGIGFAPQTQWAPPSPVRMPDNMSHMFGLNDADTDFNATVPIKVSAATTTTGSAGRVGTVLGKRDRKCSNSGSPRKRGRLSSWVLEEAEGSATRTHHTPATWTQQEDKRYIHESTTQGIEARFITAQGLHPYPLPGPSALQAMRGSPEQGQSERGKQRKTQHEPSRTQQIEPHAGGSAEGSYAIRSTLTNRQRLMLRTTKDEVERKAVSAIRCKLCPSVKLNSWQCFQRHCNTSEDHPVQLTYCERCGDHFGRRDSEKRHKGKKNQEGCRSTPRDQAEWKEKTAKQLFEDFNANLESCLRTGEELGPRFAAIVQAKVTNTSKKLYKRKASPEA